MEAMIRLLIIEDHEIFLNAFGALLTDRGYEVVGKANNAETGIRLARELQPDLIIMDIEMKPMTGLEAAKILKARDPQTRILLITAFAHYRYIQQARAINVDGYVLKSMPIEDLEKAIRQIETGKPYYPAEVSKVLMDFVDMNLTERNLEIVGLVGQGESNEAIADLLSISVDTVKWHRKQIKARSGIDAADLARQLGYL